MHCSQHQVCAPSSCLHLGNCRPQTKQTASPHPRNVTPNCDTELTSTNLPYFDIFTTTQYPRSSTVIMAPGQKAYPRGTVKKIVKAHSNCNLSKNVDVMVG